ncbi:AraC family transcriptional regulator [Jiangella ureilytica]|uniref:AraC family transcriptional regulator n=1 Tax=Jiangella ureilytica TaxID=2530374 RepID=A0A4R4RHI2_9ACTN|nr:AraC family transcriptional regulator [Jiangella ureilytica]TDC48774.1 AraC family transcriptional regulator [Jiangella ureilytica]
MVPAVRDGGGGGAVLTARRSELRWPGLRSVYCWQPPTGRVGVSEPQQIGVSFAEHRGVVAESGGHGDRFDIRPGDVFANGRSRVYWSEVVRPDELVEMYPGDDLLRAAAGSSRTPEIEPLRGVRDAVVLGAASILKRAHVGAAYVDTVRASALAHRLAEHVVGHYAGIAPPRRALAGRLDRVLLDRVADVVETRLGDPLTVDDLAAAATLSPFHFARAFKATTGLAPHEYVTSRRMERAKSLLLNGRLSVPQVAYSVGLSNLSHFRRQFRRHTGYLPSQLRTAGSDPPGDGVGAAGSAA